jgi:putative MATE family efflux protein
VLKAPANTQEILKIALPVGLESTYQLVLGLVLQVVVGTLGTAAIASVGLANNVTFIGILCMSTLGSGCAILTSRALGKSDTPAAHRIISFSLVFALFIALAIAIPLFVFAKEFLVLTGAKTEIVSTAAPFLSIVALTLPLITLSMVASSAFRSIGRAKLPTVVTMLSMSLGPVLAWLLVSQLGWGVTGAAWALLAAQGLRALGLVALLLTPRWGIRWSWPALEETKTILNQMTPLVLPLFVTELLFSGGSFLFALLFERLGTEALAAFQIMVAVENIFITALLGFNSAATILVAHAIGRKDIPSIVLNALFMPVKVSNMIFFGILSSGGDTRFLVVSDFITVFVVGLPLAYLLAFPMGMGLWGIFLGRLLGEELVRIGLFIVRYRAGQWFRKAT